MIDIPKDIPNKTDFPQVKKLDRQIIRAAVLLGLDNQTAFALYHPECLNGLGRLNDAGKKENSHFWSYGKNREYREVYEKCVEEYINGGKADDSFNAEEAIDGDALARKILSDLAAMIKNGRIQDYEVLKIATDILNKYGVLKGSEEKQIPPIRVLPSRCSECRMRIAVESMVLNGELLDMCQYCKCRHIAEDTGYRFNDGKNLLEIPQEVIAELESKNNVKLTDILEGRIPN